MERLKEVITYIRDEEVNKQMTRRGENGRRRQVREATSR